MAKHATQKSLSNWTKEEWGTKSGKNSTQGKKATGERYLPKKARAALSDKEYARSTANCSGWSPASLSIRGKSLVLRASILLFGHCFLNQGWEYEFW